MKSAWHKQFSNSILRRFSYTVIRLVEKEAAAGEKDGKLSEDEEQEEAEHGVMIDSIAEEEVEAVIAGLEEITKVYVNAENLLVSTVYQLDIIKLDKFSQMLNF